MPEAPVATSPKNASKRTANPQTLGTGTTSSFPSSANVAARGLPLARRDSTGRLRDSWAPTRRTVLSKSAPLGAAGMLSACSGGADATISRLGDLKAWGKEIATGRLLKPATQAERLKSRRFNGVRVHLGCGLGCERANDFISHNGAIFGFSTMVFHDPPADLTLAVVGNESTNSTTPTSTFGY
jgi:D-alanyl-D-alanine carboxypeptidase